MRVAVFFVGICLALVLGYGAYLLTSVLVARHERSRLAAQRWHVHHSSRNGLTVVAVQLALEGGRTDEHIVDQFRDTAPDWKDRFARAREEAEERAFHLNADRTAS